MSNTMSNDLTVTQSTALSPAAQFAMDEGVRGELMKFNRGEFQTGDKVVPLGTRLVAHVPGVSRGWIKFGDKGEPPVQHVGRVAEGFVPPARETLGDLDASQWEAGLNGEPSDPWQPVVYLPLINTSEGPDEGSVVTFTTMSKTGRMAVANLCSRYETLSWKYRGQLPIVELGSRTLDNAYKTKVPTLSIVAWQSALGEGAPLADAPPIADELNDQIPF